MNGIKYAFGLLLLGAAVYLATPFLPYVFTITAYALILLLPGAWLLVRLGHFSGKLKGFSAILGVVLLGLGGYFVVASLKGQPTWMHRTLSLSQPHNSHFGRSFTQPQALNTAMQQAFAADPAEPVLVDFYADWCVTCKKMAANTLADATVKRTLKEERFLQIDVTANTPEQQSMLKEYGLYGPPGLFMVYADGRRSAPLLGFVPPDVFLSWYAHNHRHE